MEKCMRNSKWLLIVIVFFAVNLLVAEDFDKSKLPKLLGASNTGTEFYFTFIPCWETPKEGNFLKIYVSSSVATNVTVSVSGKEYSESKMTIPNDVIEFNLSPDIGQAYRKRDRDVPQPEQVYKGAAVHVSSDAPVVCYGVVRYMYTSDGFLAIPVTSLGEEYVVASYADPTPNDIQWLPSYTGISAPYDNTVVEFTMCGTDYSKTAGGLLPGETSKFYLNQGDVLLFGSLGAHADLSGSRITATNPVSVVSGNFCAYVPTNAGCCDVLIEQEIPTFSWGTEYHVTRIVNRLKNSMIKIFAKENETKIFRDYQQIGFINDIKATEGQGHLHLRASEGEARPIVISGDKPIGVTQFNTGQMDDNIPSDPFQMVLFPIQQYQKDITFNTPGIKGGYGFPQNYINICYQSDESGRIPEDFMYAKVVGGEFQWTALKDFSSELGKPFAHNEGGNYFFSKTIQIPEDGVYKLKCSTPFAAYGYGFSSYDSYGFPLAGSYIEEIGDIIPPKTTVKSNKDGIIKGSVSTEAIGDTPHKLFGPDFENNSSLSLVMLYEPESYNFAFNHSTYTPGKDKSADWELNVVDKGKEARAVVIFSDRSGNDTALVFSYKPVGVEESNSENNLIVYPQPVVNKMTVNYISDLRSNLTIHLFDINGNIVKELLKTTQIETGANYFNFELSDLPTGTYNLQLNDNGSIITKKINILR